MRKQFVQITIKVMCLVTITLLSLNAKAQQSQSISGVVQDNSGTIPGVLISIKDTTNGTVTSADGTYTIEASRGDVLIFSSLGYEKQEITVDSQTIINVLLVSSTSEMDEVVVVGYGTKSRRNVTGSVVKVDMKQTENLPNTNISQALRGRVAGVQFTDNGRPGQGGGLLLRGPRSLSGGNSPLIIVDGIMFNGSINFINPNDVESMEVLKDASAAAIYGSRAANGVLLITTKKGKTEKPTIQLNTFFGLSNWSKKVNLLSPERYIDKTLEMRRVLGLEADPAKISSYLAPSEVANFEAGKTIDPWEEISQTGKISSVDLSLSGRTDKTNYYLSASFTDEKGLIFNDIHNRLSVRSNIENQVTDWIAIGVNASFLRRDLSGLEANISNAYYNSPYGTWYHEGGLPTRWTVVEDQVSNNPMYNAVLNTNEEIYYNLFTNFYAIVDVPFVNGLNYRVNYSPNYRADHNYNFTRQDIFRTDNHTSASKFNRQEFDWVHESILTYTRDINQDHSFDITLLYGQNHFGFETTSAIVSQLSSDALGWNNLGLGGVQRNASSASMQNGISSMFRLNYRLLDKYLFTFTVRRDGSSVFAKNNKYATFPSGAISWILSEEPFLQQATFLDMLKFRLSYGAVGNQAINPYQSISTSGISRYVFGNGGPTSVGVFTNRMANSDLKWETTYTANAAIDFELFRNRIGGSLEIYHLNTRDLLVQRSLPTMSGFTSVWSNLGATTNKGVELTLNTVNVNRTNFIWNSSLTFSANRNKIIHLYRSDTDGDGKEDDDLGNLWFIGKPMNIAYDFEMDGIYLKGDEIPSGFKPGDVRLKDLNNDGLINAEDRKIIGLTGEPLFRWGLYNDFQYKQFSLSVFVNAMQGWISGFRFADPNSNFGNNFPARALNQFDNEWWTPENESNKNPSLGYNNPFQHNYYFSRDFIRIQDISLSYELSERWTQRFRLTNLRLFISAKNALTLTKWPGTDPESGGGAKSFPMPKTISIGLNTGF